MVGAVKRFEERRMRNGFFVSNDAVRNLVVSCPQFTFMQLAVLDHGYYMLWFGFASLVLFLSCGLCGKCQEENRIQISNYWITPCNLPRLSGIKRQSTLCRLTRAFGTCNFEPSSEKTTTVPSTKLDSTKFFLLAPSL